MNQTPIITLAQVDRKTQIASSKALNQRKQINTIETNYVNVPVLIKFSQKTSVFTLIIISSP